MTPLAAPAPAASSLLTRLAVGVSIAVHVCAVLLSLGYAGAGLFESQEAPAVEISLVSPQDMPPELAQPENDVKPEPDLSQLDLRMNPAESTPDNPQTKPAEAQQAASHPSQPGAQDAPRAQPQSQPQPSKPTYAQPQPDLSMRYGVDLGLKMLTPTQTASAQDSHSDFDAPAMANAEIDRSSIAAFRARLKQCAALPAQIAPDDKVVIVLRASFTPDARLASAPVLIEASASAKGPALMQAAMSALETCQPHNVLPAKDYAEWRTLDLRFTPQDFKRS